MRNLALSAFMACVVSINVASAQQQTGSGTTNVTVIGKGSTVEGDIRRGQGVFLQGLGWYELNDAKAAAQNADTMMRLENWNREVQLAYRREYNAAIEQKNYKTKKAFEEAQRKHIETETRLRVKPTSDDIASGDALNALLADLSDPTIQASSWRGAKVRLPDDITIKGLAFRFTPKGSAKENAALTRGLIALGRLDTSGRWPDVFPLDKLKAEIASYEASYAKIRDQSIAGRLEYEPLDQLEASLQALRSKVGVVVHAERGFRREALKFVDGLKEATKMFDASTLSFAREMIADTSRHEAHTVGELLAFMRKYRLIFAQADASPGGEEVYARLYGLLKQQTEALGLKPAQELAGPAGPEIPGDAIPFQGSHFKVFNEELTWHQAENRCREVGGHLAMPINKPINDFVTEQVRRAGLDTAWLGATDERIEKRWLWIDGSEMRFDAWDTKNKQPNNKGEGEHYLLTIMSRDGLWSDQPARAESKYHPGFVCQWQGDRAPAVRREPVRDAFQPGSVWVGKSTSGTNFRITVTDRKGESFTASFEDGPNLIREINGRVEGNKVTWFRADSKMIKGDHLGNDNFGTLSGDVLSIRVVGPNVNGNYTLRLKEKQ